VSRLGPASTGAWIVGLGGSAAAPRQLDPSLSPVGYAADGTLMAMVMSPTGPRSLVLVNVDNGDRIPLAHPPPAASLGTLDLSSGLRRFAFIAAGTQGADEVFIENADGSASSAITTFGRSGFDAVAVTLSG